MREQQERMTEDHEKHERGETNKSDFSTIGFVHQKPILRTSIFNKKTDVCTIVFILKVDV